ncbi:MAG: hypothetical protein EOO14_06375 [Chitinophagaceae bacterium]|nr:MAG: hypothetical protein EOO14_06375 [Chitinophagaceae bacterium]
MKKHFTIFCFSLAALLCGTRLQAQLRADGGVMAARAQSAKGQTSSAQQIKEMQKDFLQDVLFATNANCRVFINNEVKGLVSKDRFFLPEAGTRHLSFYCPQ